MRVIRSVPITDSAGCRPLVPSHVGQTLVGSLTEVRSIRTNVRTLSRLVQRLHIRWFLGSRFDVIINGILNHLAEVRVLAFSISDCHLKAIKLRFPIFKYAKRLPGLDRFPGSG